jgi:hypothetical protein
VRSTTLNYVSIFSGEDHGSPRRLTGPPSATGAFRRLAAPLTKITCLELLPFRNCDLFALRQGETGKLMSEVFRKLETDSNLLLLAAAAAFGIGSHLPDHGTGWAVLKFSLFPKCLEYRFKKPEVFL